MRGWYLGLWLALWCAATSLSAAEFDDVARELRVAMAQREFPRAQQKLAELRELAKSDAEQTTFVRLELLHGYLFDFWKAVHAGGRTLQGTDELKFGELSAAVVEYNEGEGRLVLRISGQNKQYTLKEMPSRVVLTLAAQHLKEGAPENEPYIGAFLAMDSRGDRQLARQSWERAIKGGVDVKALLPELDIPLPAEATLQIPVLTPATAANLRPQFWSLMQSTDKGWKPTDLAKHAEQSVEGRLLVTAPGDAGASAWITFKRKMPVNFGVRLYLVDVPAGQKLGMFVGKAKTETDAYIDLPAGTVKVEIARQAGKFLCRINDQEQPVTIVDEKTAKSSSLFGFTLPSGSKCQIAGCEFANK